MEKYSEYIKKFKIALGIVVVAIVVCGLIITKLIPEFQNLLTIQTNYKEQTALLADTERKLENLKKSYNKKNNETKSLVKAFHKPVTMGVDSETAISNEFGEILQIIRENKIKTRSLDYEYDPQDDKFVKNASDKYHVCRIKAEMIATYSDFVNFLRDLYKHEHFLEISEIEVIPYRKDKRILLITTKFKLYALKNENADVAAPEIQKNYERPALQDGNPELP